MGSAASHPLDLGADTTSGAPRPITLRWRVVATLAAHNGAPQPCTTWTSMRILDDELRGQPVVVRQSGKDRPGDEVTLLCGLRLPGWDPASHDVRDVVDALMRAGLVGWTSISSCPTGCLDRRTGQHRPGLLVGAAVVAGSCSGPPMRGSAVRSGEQRDGQGVGDVEGGQRPADGDVDHGRAQRHRFGGGFHNPRRRPASGRGDDATQATRCRLYADLFLPGVQIRSNT